MLIKAKEFDIAKKDDGSFVFLGVFNNRILWINNNKLLFFDERIFEFLSTEKIGKCLLLNNEYIYLETYNAKQERGLINLKNLEYHKLEPDVEVYSGNEMLLIGIDNHNRNTAALKTKSQEYSWVKKGMHYFTQIKHFTFSRDSEMLALYNNNTGEEEWKVSDFSAFNYETRDFVDESPEQHKATIHRIVGVYDNVVWITLNSGRLLGYSMIDGKLLYNLALPNYYYNGFNPTSFHQSFCFGSYSQLDEQQGMLFGLLRDEYWEIDLNDPENTFILYSLKESARHFDLTADGNMFQPFTNNEIFFYMLYPKTNAFGVFDRNLKEIVWAAPVEKSSRGFPSIRKMEYENERLYLLTDNSKIIIYEKET